MTETTETHLPDGMPARVLTKAQVDVLIEIIERDLWWHGARKRLKAMGGWAATGAAGLTLLSLWWPWIDRTIRLLIVGIPA